MIGETDRLLYQRTLIRLAGVHVKLGEINDAISIVDRLAGLKPNGPDISYQVAALYAQTGQPQKAFEWLETAVGQGFRDESRLISDARFDSVRRMQEFLEIKRQMATAKKGPHHSS